MHEETVDHDHETDRERIVAEISSHSSVGALPPDQLQAALDAVRAVLERHAIERVAVPLRATILTVQKRSGDSGPSAG